MINTHTPLGQDNRGQTLVDFLTAFTLIIILFSLVITYTFTFLPLSTISDESSIERQAVATSDELIDRTFTPTNSQSTQPSATCTAAFFTEHDGSLGCQNMDESIDTITGITIQESTEISIETLNGDTATVDDISPTSNVIGIDNTAELTRGDTVLNPRIRVERPIAFNGETYKLIVKVQ